MPAGADQSEPDARPSVGLSLLHNVSRHPRARERMRYDYRRKLASVSLRYSRHIFVSTAHRYNCTRIYIRTTYVKYARTHAHSRLSPAASSRGLIAHARYPRFFTNIWRRVRISDTVKWQFHMHFRRVRLTIGYRVRTKCFSLPPLPAALTAVTVKRLRDEEHRPVLKDTLSPRPRRVVFSCACGVSATNDFGSSRLSARIRRGLSRMDIPRCDTKGNHPVS